MSRDLHVIKRMVLGAPVALLLVVIYLCSAHSKPAPAPAPAQVTTVAYASSTPLQNVTASHKFDGHLVYGEVFKYMRDQNIALVDPVKRARWVAKWEHKHDHDGRLDTKKGTDKACLELIDSLDQRYNFYIADKQWEAIQEQEHSSFCGVGMPVGIKGFNKVYKSLPKHPTRKQIKAAITASVSHPFYVSDDPFPGSPAKKAGVHAGDVIVAVNGKTAYGRQTDELVSAIRGPENTVVRITVRRVAKGGQEHTLTFTLRRAQITTHSVHFVDEGDGISYIKVDDFLSELLLEDWSNALFEAAAGKALVVDLRGNLGGSLPYVEFMIETLLKQGTELEIRSRNGDSLKISRTILAPDLAIAQTEVDSSGAPAKAGVEIQALERAPLLIPDSMPIVVLVDEDSYSASEILSGALQANHRAYVVGEVTGGKGVGQNVDQLGFEREVHVTNFEFLPGGQPMDWVGIIPNHRVKEGEDDTIAHGNPRNDTQLREAIEVVKSLVRKQQRLQKERQAAKRKHEKEFKQRRALQN